MKKLAVFSMFKVSWRVGLNVLMERVKGCEGQMFLWAPQKPRLIGRDLGRQVLANGRRKSWTRQGVSILSLSVYKPSQSQCRGFRPPGGEQGWSGQSQRPAHACVVTPMTMSWKTDFASLFDFHLLLELTECVLLTSGFWTSQWAC